MKQKEYVECVLKTFNNPNGRKLLEFLSDECKEKIRSFEMIWNSTDSSIKKDDRALYCELGKFNIIEAFLYIIDNRPEVIDPNNIEIKED